MNIFCPRKPAQHLPLLAGCILWGSLLAPLGAYAGTISTNPLAEGTRFATQYYVHDSGAPGPTVMIVGGAHGNEPAGAAAAESIRHWNITKGKLVVIPRCNVPALSADKRNIPGLDEELGNLNRNYPRAGKDEPARGELAAAIWAVALKSKPDWMLDLHEGYDFNQVNGKSVGSSIICFPDPRGKEAAALMLTAVNETISDKELKFVPRGTPVDGSLARAAGEHLHIPAMTLETTSKQPMDKRVQQHEIMVRRLLKQLSMLSAADSAVTSGAKTSLPVTVTATSSAGSAVRIALYKGPGTGGAGPPSLLRRLQDGNRSSITEVTPEQIRNGILSNYDVVLFAGGSGSKQAEAIGEEGREQVRLFVEKGGGYAGICAGAYLATSGYPWSLHIINAETVSPKWRRGVGEVKVELTDGGEKILGDRSGQFDVHYANGPIVRPGAEKSLPPFEPLAYFRTELAKNETPEGVMVNSPAIFSAPFKHGRVICISPHPEQTTGLEDFVPRAINWLISKDPPDRKVSSPGAE